MRKNAKELAQEIVAVFKYNPQLTDDERVLAIETRLDYLISGIEREQPSVLVDERPQDIPLLRDAMLNAQTQRGQLN